MPSNCYQWVSRYYLIKNSKAIYGENVEPLGDPYEWEHPMKIPMVLPPPIERQHFDHLSEQNKRPSQREKVHQVVCIRCHESGCTRLICTNPLPYK